MATNEHGVQFEIGDLTDVDLTGLLDGDLLIYDSGTDTWIRVPSSSFGGGSAFQFVHDQAVASAGWTITHSLGGFPNVTIVDTNGEQIEADIDYLDNNTLQVNFSTATAGKAYLS